VTIAPTPTTLDNAVWHALAGPQAPVAHGGPLARRYHPDISIFGALPDQVTPETWTALAALIATDGPDGAAVLFRDVVEPPTGWTEHLRVPGWQMTGAGAEARPAPTGAHVQRLGADDVADMLDLIARTEPGPFQLRTIELGRYIGVRDETGALAAMAGERMRLDGHTEISAVCTDPDHRGRGLAGLLVRDLVADITSRAEVPFLHVASTNIGAIRLYESLGFTKRREVMAVMVQPPTDDGGPPPPPATASELTRCR